METSKETPLKNKHLLKANVLKIPASPYMKKIGFGTGVAVYELQRSPISNKENSPWAIKKLVNRNNLKCKQMLNSRVRTEAEVLRKLNHPNIIGFRAFAQEKDGRNVLAMEECPNCLGDMIETRFENNEGPFSAKQIEKVMLDITSALNYLHTEALLLHCDIKSYNILLKGDFAICKLCDFGVCLPLTKNGNLDVEKAGADADFVGTESWCAPEILTYPQTITNKADIYSLGLVVWEMLALMPPTIDNLEDSNCEENLRQRPDLPEDVEIGEEYIKALQIFYCCTMTDYNDRPNAEDLLKIIEN